MNLLDGFYIALAGATAPWWARKSRAGWPERLGRRTPLLGPSATGRPRILLHAVSVGEVNALRTLVPLLTSASEVVISATTDTGLARARELFGATSTVVRFPLDFSGAVRRFLDGVSPDVVGLVELELWPNFMKACAQRGVPVAVINGRLSERSFRGYRRIRFFMRRLFAGLEFAAVQDADYAARFEAMGVSPDSCLVTGSMKWDAAPVGSGENPAAAALALDLGIDRTRPLIVAGSTGPGEEALIHESAPKGVQLLCAPRKPERFDEAAKALPGCMRRSRLGGDTASNRWLLDSVGELRNAYCLADLVIIGRSFGDLFGSDPIEPIALGKPVVIGPRFGDFEYAVRALDTVGGIFKTDRSRLGADLAALMADPVRRAELARAGAECIQAHRGASHRHAELLLSLGEIPGSARATGADEERHRVVV